MTERQGKCIEEIKKLIEKINEVVLKHGLENEFISCFAAGFIDMNNFYTDDEGVQRANISLLSSMAVEDEYELDELLFYCSETYRIEQEEKKDTSNIEYWINFGKRNGDVN